MRFSVPLRLPTCKLIFSQKCTGHETLLNICRTNDNKHHKAYIFSVLSKKKILENLKKFQASP